MHLSLTRLMAWIATAVTAAALAACGPQRHDTPELFASQLQSVDKLQLGQMAISKMASIDDLRLADAHGLRQTADALLDALKIGARKAVYSYDTYMRAYVDLGELTPADVVIDHDRKHVQLLLPPIRTEFVGRDAEIREIHYRVTGLRSAIGPDERAVLKDAMGAALKREVQQRSEFRRALEEAARAKGRRYFENFFASQGYTATVEFR